MTAWEDRKVGTAKRVVVIPVKDPDHGEVVDVAIYKGPMGEMFGVEIGITDTNRRVVEPVSGHDVFIN